MLFWIMILRNRFFHFSLLNIFGAQSSEPLQKKSNLLHVQYACAHIFFLRGNVLKKCRRDLNCSLDHSSSWVKNSIISPTKIEQHFGGFWNFETPLMLLSLSQKVVYSMRWKILFSSNIQWIPLVCMFFKIYLTLHINVQSGKIGSAWEWCRWIGKSTRAIGFSFLFITLEYIW
jgi:hypothetical protein